MHPKFLMDEAVKMYIGSVTCPKNHKVAAKLLAKARELSTTKEQLRSVEYY